MTDYSQYTNEELSKELNKHLDELQYHLESIRETARRAKKTNHPLPKEVKSYLESLKTISASSVPLKDLKERDLFHFPSSGYETWCCCWCFRELHFGSERKIEEGIWALDAVSDSVESESKSKEFYSLDAPYPNSATREHVVPKQRGGPDRFENVALACKECNNKRGHHIGPPDSIGKKLSDMEFWFLTQERLHNGPSEIDLDKLEYRPPK